MYVHYQQYKNTHNLGWAWLQDTSAKEILSHLHTQIPFSLMERVQEIQATSGKNWGRAKVRGDFSLGIFCLYIVIMQTYLVKKKSWF